MMIAATAVGLLALGWGGASVLRRTADGIVTRPPDPSLTDHFASLVAASAPSEAPQAGRPAPAAEASPADRVAFTGPSADRAPARAAPRPGSVLELQRFRSATSMEIRGPGGRSGTAVLTDLNPAINEGYLLELRWRDGEKTSLHLENARPESHRLVLDADFPSGLVLSGSGAPRRCDLWSERVPGLMRDVAKRRRPYTELCDGAVLVRHRTRGSRTAREWAADFLRSNVPGGEGLTSLAKNTLYPDAFLEQAELAGGAPDATETPEAPVGLGAPLPALVSPESRNDRLVSRELGISTLADGALVVGRWYPAVGTPGVFVSLLTPGRVSREVLGKSAVRDLDEVESGALVYLVAFDLERFDLGFGLGTDHPGVGWSDRVPSSVRDPGLPGPDGFSGLEPLEPTGFVPPQLAGSVVATFAAGFKRAHGAFRSGALARVNAGSHYGFVEEGVVLSRLQPGLSTLFALDDGSVEMKTWTGADDALLGRVRSARQNGVPLLELDSRTGGVVPGALVGRWGEGNWGGSEDARLRSVRAGAGLMDSAGRRFLVFGYFSSATPSAMAVVFASVGCRYAMHLDMNAPEHTYLALYRASNGRLDVEHLVRAMSVLDKTSGGTTVPRFLGVADNRDFFYLTRKRGSKPRVPAGTDVARGSPATPGSP